MAVKRRRTAAKRKIFRGKKRKTTYKTQMAVAKKVVQQVIARNIETKSSNHNVVTTNVVHNRLTMIDSGLFNTSQGDSDNDMGSTLNRTGDEVNLRGLSIRFLLEMHQSFSDVTYRVMVIKAAKGDTPNLSTLFVGLSTCKILDQINNERFSVVYSKTYKQTARNPGVGDQQQFTFNQVTGAGLTTGNFLGGATGNFAPAPLGRAVKVCKIWIPGAKLFRNGLVRYENATTQTKFFGYHLIMYAYVNSETDSSESGAVIAAQIKHYICQMYYKDA